MYIFKNRVKKSFDLKIKFFQAEMHCLGSYILNISVLSFCVAVFFLQNQ